MPYTIKPKATAGFGSFSVLAADGHEALDAAKGMIERGIEEIEILDDDGRACDPSELASIANSQ